jgi:hypothetical protein
MSRALTATAVLGVAVLAAVAWTHSLTSASTPAPPQAATQSPPPAQNPPPAQSAPPPSPGGAPPFVTSFVDTFAAERDSFANLVMERIAGREDAPAESVFKNIKFMKQATAGRLVGAMNNIFGRSLGVSCDFCHVPNHWADDDKKQKAIARDMMEMVGSINSDLVPKMKSLEGERVFIGCATCHQGHHKPPRLGGPGRGGPPGGGPRHD